MLWKIIHCYVFLKSRCLSTSSALVYLLEPAKKIKRMKSKIKKILLNYKKLMLTFMELVD